MSENNYPKNQSSKNLNEPRKPRQPRGRSPEPPKPNKDDFRWKKASRTSLMWIIIILSSIVLLQILGRGAQEEVVITYSQYKELLDQKLIKSAVIIENEFHGTLTQKVPLVVGGRTIEAEKILVNLRFVDSEMLKSWDEAGIEYDFKVKNTKWTRI